MIKEAANSYIIKPYMKWQMSKIDNSVNYFDVLNELIPDWEAKVYKSTVDEVIVTETDLNGTELRTSYVLKATKNGSKFEYKHELKETDDIAQIRDLAWIQKEAWEFKMNENKTNKTEQNGEEK